MASEEDLYSRLTESPTIRSFQRMLAPIVTRPTKEKKKKAKPSTAYADYPTSWSPPNKGKDLLPPFEDRFNDIPEPMRSTIMDCCRSPIEQCLADVTAEIEGLMNWKTVTLPEDILAYDTVVEAADIVGVDAAQVRRGVRDLITFNQEKEEAIREAARRRRKMMA